MDKPKMKSIEIVLENCEVIEIPADRVASFCLNDIRERISNDWYSNRVWSEKICYSFKLILSPDADVEIDENINDNKVFDRINKYKDITSVIIIYEDGSDQEIKVIWDDSLRSTNWYQTSIITNNGYLIIFVSPTEKADQFREMVEKVPNI